MKEEKKKVLIVEDESQMARILEDRLVIEGYEVVVARDGEEAVRQALAVKPDVILLDIVLPKKNGAEVLAEILSDSWGKTARITFLTNLGDIPESIQKAMKENKYINYIVKVDTSLDDIIKHVKKRLGE